MENEFLRFSDMVKVMIKKGLLPENPANNSPAAFREVAVRYMCIRGDRMVPWEYEEFADFLTPDELVQAEELNRMAIERIKDE